LLESNNPLIEELREKAPGTFQHSKNVSALLEAVALKLGLNVNLLKVVGLVHNIGKIFNPKMFNENQNGINPHNELDPGISYEIITRHVGDGVLYLMQNGVSVEILNIVSQHHGNTILRYFYDKVCKSDPETVPTKYRYRSSPPTSVEAAVLMICDSVEATAKSLANNKKLETYDDRKKVVDETVSRLVSDDQLDNMKVGHLKRIKRILYKELDSLDSRNVIYGEDEEDDISVKDAKKKLVEELGE
jgi:hypothetical protein